MRGTQPCPENSRRLCSKGQWPTIVLFACLILRAFTPNDAAAQTAFISDAWWTFQQDCNGDGCKAGTLPGDLARLNWEPDVTNCNGALIVYETVYSKPCDLSVWTAIYTNSPHSITACRSIGQQHLDVSMAASCACRDYKIEIYRSNQPTPDHVRSNFQDPDLAQHREELLGEDFCLSDYFATCVSLSGNYGSHSENNENAAKELGEPDHAGDAGGHSLWFCWTALTNAEVRFDTIGSAFDTLLAVYTGDSVSNLTLIAGNDDIAGATNRLSSLQFLALAGTTYHIAVDGFGGASGIVTLNWNQTAKALPDLTVWGPATFPTIVTRTFTNGDCEVLEGCATAGTHRLLSFSMETRNVGNGDLVVGSPTNSPLFIWANCHKHWHFEQFAEYNLLDTNGNIVATGHKVGFCLEDIHSFGQPGAPLGARYDCVYQGIQRGWADVYEAGLPCQYIDISSVAPGDYILQVTVNPDNLFAESRTDNNTALVPITIPPADCAGAAPLNDDFTNSLSITHLPFTHMEFNSCANKESDEPDHAGNLGGHSVWFAWTPTSNQTATVTTKQSDFDTLLAVYAGSALSTISVVASNDDIIPDLYSRSQLTFPATAGTTYHIAVDGWGGAVGTVVLNVNPANNDDFNSNSVLSGLSGTATGSTIGTSKEPDEPAHASDVGGHSIWYRWIAPTNGPVDFNTFGSAFDTTLAIYTGNVLTNLTNIVSNDDDPQSPGVRTSRLWFNAVAGQGYRIAVDGFGGDSGDFRLSWTMESRIEIAQLPNGGLQLSLQGVDSQRYTLLGSTNLATWFTNFRTITMSGGFHRYTNNPATSSAEGQFYRALRVP